MTGGRRRALLAGFAATTVLAGCGGSDEPTTEPPSGNTTDSPSGAEAAYADGIYRARGTYGGGPSYIVVRLRIRDGEIETVDVTPQATDPTSLDYQRRFADAVPDEVIGRDLADVEVSRLAGSSGTPDGFNDALEQIRSQAEQ